MANNDNIRNVKKPKFRAAQSGDYRYKLRTSYYNMARHFNDKYKNLGYNYRGKLLTNTTSREIWANPLQRPVFARLELLINYILEQVKYIKKTFSIAHSKDSININ